MLLFSNYKWISRIYLRRCNYYFQNRQGKNLYIWLVSELKLAVSPPNSVSWNEPQDISPVLLSHLLVYPAQNHPIAQWYHQEITSSETQPFISAPPLSSFLDEVSISHQFPFGPQAGTMFSLDINFLFPHKHAIKRNLQKVSGIWGLFHSLSYCWGRKFAVDLKRHCIIHWLWPAGHL